MPKKFDYSDWTKDDLIERLNKLEKRKKYGLVWDEEREPEDVVLQCKKELPVLKEVKSKNIKTNSSKPIHILIEGDNYQSLSVLNYTHDRSIDVIYIDPPFNTGSRSWKFNNAFVDKEDSYRHSKFITFIYNRLKLSRRLLKKDGIIIVAIDDHEGHHIRMLLDEIFKENNRLGTVAVVHNPRGRSDDKFFATSHEYMLIYSNNEKIANVKKLEASEEQLEVYNLEDDISFYRELPFRRSGSNSRKVDRPNLFYPIYYDIENGNLSVEKIKGAKKILPKDTAGNERVWRWGKNTFTERLQTEIVVKENNGDFTINTKDRIKKGRKAKTIWHDPKYDASSHGTLLLKKILGKRDTFDYPKSLYLLYDILSITTNDDSTVLDFFAGSGTTGHAILMLNKKQKSNRRFILATNNENEICREVCYPRIKNVIKGYKETNGESVSGLPGNLRYYKTAFVPSEPTDRNKEILTKQSVEMLCLKEYTFEIVNETDTIKIFKNDEKYTVILFDELEIPELKEQIKDFDKPVNVYIFSLGDDDFLEEFADMNEKVKVCSIPAAILRVYKRIFR